MKPLKLIMSAFGPYSDKCEVDFTKLGDNGIFLVTGDTGAGKTTIFDGISFALFGEASGNNRNTESFRSKFAESTVETYVELTFSHRDKVYTITRNPAYLVPKKRGTGETTKAADATIVYDDKVVTGLKIVNEKVIEILGINAKQFKQIAMLAQGEFLKILHADSDERQNIFRKIFGTEVFELITIKLNGKYKDNKNTIESLKTEFITNTNNIVLSEKELEFDKINITKESILNILEELKNEISLNDAKLSELEETIKLKDSEYKVLENSIKTVEDNNKRIELLNKLKEEEKLLKIREKLINDNRKIIEDNKQILRMVKPIESDILKIQGDIKDIEDKINSKKNIIKDLEVLEGLIGEKEEKIKLLSPLLEEYNSINEDIIKNSELLGKIVEVLEFYKEKELLDNKYLLEYEEYKNIDIEYKEADDKYFRNQAGILASKLEVNMPCPVCGSLEHPSIAVIEDNVLNKEELEKKKKQVEDKWSFVSKVKEDISVLVSKIEVSIKSLDCVSKEDILTKKKEIEDSNSNVQEKHEDIKNKFREIIESICSEKYSIESFNLVNFIEKFNKDNVKVREDLQANKKLIEEYSNSLEKLSKSLEDENRKLEEVILSLGFKNYDDYLSKILSEDELSKKEVEIKDYERDVTSNKTRIEEIEKVLTDRNIKDLTNDKKKLEELRQEVVLVTEKKQNIYSIYDNNMKIFKRLSITSNKLIEYMDKFSLYEELYKLSSGNVSGKRRISFEQYVQATYFDMVLMEANMRLSNMTDGRFKLLRKADSSNLGSKFALDLDVFDEYNGSRRDVKSLSGGESFKASLSLALGLSDVIQRYSGGIVVDTLFIDEGFGSLDQESREQAINTLNLLSNNNKLIGIISHVSELKERIYKKIIVSKTRDGSEIRIEV